MADPHALTIAETPIALAWNVRGDPRRTSFAAAVERALGIALPTQANAAARDGDTALLGLGPRSWLYLAGTQPSRSDFDAARRMLNDAHGALFDVSSSYVAWTISGAASASVLNRGCPLDLHPSAFPAQRCAQSLFGHVNALIYRPDERAAFVVAVARSFASDAWEQLCACAKTDGWRPQEAIDELR